MPSLSVEPLIGKGWAPDDGFLTLSVRAPEGAKGAPVLVFIHGGGFVIGGKDAPVQDGTTIARDGVVCVAINYRLGIDGSLPIPGVPPTWGCAT